MSNIITGYTGISFPFRIGVRGGVIMSSTNRYEIPHIEESIIQILGTRRMERWMEYHIFSNLEIFMFEPNNRSLHTLFKHQLKEAMRNDRRVKIMDINFIVSNEFLDVDIHFRVENYQTTKPLRVRFNRQTGKLAKNYFPMRDSGGAT